MFFRDGRCSRQSFAHSTREKAAHKWWSTIAIQEVYGKISMATRINSVSVAEALHVEEEASGISATQAELVGGLHSNQNARMY